MTDIFISYSAKDAPIANDLAMALRTEGYSVWWDRRLAAGDNFAELIEQRLAAASAVLVLWTPDSIDSSWVREEASYAREQNKLLPIKVGNVQMPFGFKEISAINLRNWSGDKHDPAFEVIKRSIERLVAEKDRSLR
jgi:hypothetical protein